jgi:hypothetical protein
MKKIALALIPMASLLATQAHALVDFELDQNFFVVNAPTSGTSTVVLTGTVNLSSGWHVTSAATFDAVNFSTSDDLSTTLDAAFISWLIGPQSTNYSGNIADVTLTPTSGGLYDFNPVSPDGVPEIILDGTNGKITGEFADSEMFEVNVNAVPEPATMVALGLGAVAMLRRRKN